MSPFSVSPFSDDAPFRTKREAWLKAHFEKAGK
jgi:hypothetical protein